MEATHRAAGHTNQRRFDLQVEAEAAARTGLADESAPRIDWKVLRLASRSCCCPAKPAVVALIPPVPGRPHRTDLLLCMHHFRGARQALAESGATALDMQGRILDPDAPAYLSRE
jgi:hypothetical protein